jgi:hypothetical protein
MRNSRRAFSVSSGRVKPLHAAHKKAAAKIPLLVAWQIHAKT